MKELKVLILVIISLIIATSANSAERYGEEKYLQQQYWCPEDAEINFHYDQSGEFEGFEVFFKTGNVDLYRNWKLGLVPFPFVLEITLVVDDANEVADLAHEGDENKRKGVHWDFNAINKCVDQPRAYIDSHLADRSTDNFGIGIVNTQYLGSNQWYKFYIKMRTKGKDPRTLSAKLRFRLNMDAWTACKNDYKPEDDGFVLGIDWWLGYNSAKVYRGIPNEQATGEAFSFAIEKFKKSNGGEYTFTDIAIPDMKMTGTYYK